MLPPSLGRIEVSAMSVTIASRQIGRQAAGLEVASATGLIPHPIRGNRLGRGDLVDGAGIVWEVLATEGGIDRFAQLPGDPGDFFEGTARLRRIELRLKVDANLLALGERRPIGGYLGAIREGWPSSTGPGSTSMVRSVCGLELVPASGITSMESSSQTRGVVTDTSGSTFRTTLDTPSVHDRRFMHQRWVTPPHTCQDKNKGDTSVVATLCWNHLGGLVDSLRGRRYGASVAPELWVSSIGAVNWHAASPMA